MIRRLHIVEALVLAPLLVAGIAGAVAALSSRSADDAFLLAQEHPASARPSAVSQLVRKAPEPVVPNRRTPATRARCRPGAGRDLRNPWRCTVHYRSGFTAGYVVTIRANGSFIARHIGGTGVARGCCLGE